ncbi:MAG: hypothetical protein JXA37_14090 [Chloroflexia bacterium]|nr:hypothetical protein [Chloroflexia bacterium]
MENRRLIWPLAMTAGICWASWIYFLFIFQVGAISNPADPWRIAFYVLLILAPGITFFPVGIWLGWRPFALYAVLSWAAFGYLLAFSPPPTAVLTGLRTPFAVWYFFLALFAVCTTVLTPLAHAVGLRLFSSRTHQRDLLRAWREAALLSFYIVGLALARSLGLLTWPIALLSLLFMALLEALFLARKA